jgi:outer membrane lipoprotein SlyB
MRLHGVPTVGLPVTESRRNFMNASRLTALVCGGVATAMLAACSTYPVGPTYSSTTTTAPMATSTVAGTEYGRIVNIEYLPAGATVPQSSSILGAVVGGVLGAGVGSLIGAGAGRTAATVLGGVAGAAAGAHLARNQQGVLTQAGYRITMRTDTGITRTYEVPATGDLKVGDRVRVDNGVIYRG